MKLTILTLITAVTIQASNAGDEPLRKAIHLVATANRLETTRITEAGVPSHSAASFVTLLRAPNADRNFEEVAKTTRTAAGKAYAILGLYEVKRGSALAIIKSLPHNFRVEVMWYDLRYEWDREEFERQVKERRFIEAITH